MTSTTSIAYPVPPCPALPYPFLPHPALSYYITPSSNSWNFTHLLDLSMTPPWYIHALSIVPALGRMRRLSMEMGFSGSHNDSLNCKFVRLFTLSMNQNYYFNMCIHTSHLTFHMKLLCILFIKLIQLTFLNFIVTTCRFLVHAYIYSHKHSHAHTHAHTYIQTNINR